MSETPDDLRREDEDDKVRAKGLICTICTEAITSPADLESFGRNNGWCSRCAHKAGK
jgi:hypothetical protein